MLWEHEVAGSSPVTPTKTIPVMQKQHITPIIFLMILLAPILALAKPTIRAGSDDYLRYELSYTDEMLSGELITEEREHFAKASGQTKVSDPLGDVLDRLGTTSPMNVPWGDIQSAEVKHNTLEQAWEVRVEMGALVPELHTQDKAQLFVYFDHDGASANNDYEGIGADMDREFSVQYNKEEGWYTDYKWYNTEADFWGMDQETEATFLIKDNVMTVYVPFDEVPYDNAVHWRVVMALKDGLETQIDAAPGVGFPPALGQELPSKWQMPELSAGIIVLLVAGLIALVYGLWAAFSGRMKSSG